MAFVDANMLHNNGNTYISQLADDLHFTKEVVNQNG
jgi:hypothetical protein